MAEPGQPCGPDELAQLSPGDLLALSRLILAELRRREIIRSGNAPTGDYAELLVRIATGGELAPVSQKSWDVCTPAGEQFQVKARVVTNQANAGERQLSLFGSWEFDAAIIVLFDDQFRVWKAAKLPPAQLQAVAQLVTRFNSYRVMATDALLEQGDDWTERLREAEGQSSSETPGGASGPKTPYHLLTTDGGIVADRRGKMAGEAAIGVVLKAPLEEISEAIGAAKDHHVAEYRALIRGLGDARSRGIDHLRVCLDSALLVNQLNGSWQVKAEHLKPLYEQAVSLVQQFADIAITWVPRKANAEADALASSPLGPLKPKPKPSIDDLPLDY